MLVICCNAPSDALVMTDLGMDTSCKVQQLSSPPSDRFPYSAKGVGGKAEAFVRVGEGVPYSVINLI